MEEDKRYTREEVDDIISRIMRVATEKEKEDLNGLFKTLPAQASFGIVSGGTIYRSLASTLTTGRVSYFSDVPKAASELLNRAGFVGIHYNGRQDGECYVIFNENDMQIVSHEQFWRTPDGEVYGFVKDGRVYMDLKKLNPNTPVHEYGHLWSNALMKAQPELWAHGKEMMKKLPLWEEVRNDKGYQDIRDNEDLVASEVFSRLLGDEGEMLLDDMVNEAKAKGDPIELAETITLAHRIKEWLKNVLMKVRSAFGHKWTKEEAKTVTLEELKGMALKDFASGVNPAEEVRKAEQYEVVTKANPMLDDYHTGIRNPSDIASFRQAIDEAEKEWAEYGSLPYPDMDIETLREAKETGYITIYSSKPIKAGTFVTPSRMNAEDYAGGGRVYEKRVPIDQVAWIEGTNAEEGEFAGASKENKAESRPQFRFIGEKGAANIDKAEQATKVRDNLNVAREMEKAYKEKKERIEKLKKSEPVEITGEEYKGKYDLNRDSVQDWIKANLRGEYTNEDTGEKISLSKVGANKVTSHGERDEAHLKSVMAIPQLIEKSIFIEEQPNEKGNGKYDSYRYYVCGLKIGGEDYTAKVVIGVKDGSKYYDHRLTQIEKGTLIDNLNGMANSVAENQNANGFMSTGRKANPSVTVGKDTKLLSILQTNDKENARRMKIATGWERGADGKWRYEQSDGDFADSVEADFIEGRTEWTLEEFWNDEKLFKAYPELKDMAVRIDAEATHDENATAWYDPEEKEIVVSDSVLMFGSKGTIIHELQHAIQHIEGFAPGGNPSMFKDNPEDPEEVKMNIANKIKNQWVASGDYGRKVKRPIKEILNDYLNKDISTIGENEQRLYGAGSIDFLRALSKMDEEQLEKTIKDYSSRLPYYKRPRAYWTKRDQYEALAGEVEARNTQTRMSMSDAERRAILASDTEDVAREDQIFLNDALSGNNAMESRESDYSEEERTIIDRAKKDGTYMKAPNGKPTKLTEKQWAQVRTQAFKQWFGDWEKAARIEKLRGSEAVEVSFNGEYPLNRADAKQWMKDNIRGSYTNADTKEEIEVSRIGINEVTSHGTQDEAHLKSLVAIPQMIRDAIFVDEIPNEKGNDKYDSYRYYVCGLKIDGEDYTAKMVVGVKGDSKYYDHRLTQIEKGKLIDNLNGLSNSVAENQNASVSIGKDTKLLSILQTNSSKVVDENGEPLPVQHGTPVENLTKFDISHLGENTGDEGVYGAGFYFAPIDEEHTDFSMYGDNILHTYLSMKNPKEFVTTIGVGAKGNFGMDLLSQFDTPEVRKLPFGLIHGGKQDVRCTIGELIDNTRQAIADYKAGKYDALINALRPIWGKEAASQVITKKAGGAYPLSVSSFINDFVGGKALAEALKKDGYDGVVVKENKNAAPHELVAFAPNQIKSATDNNGEFSREDDDILHREGEETAPTDERISYGNDPWAKMLGSSYRTARQRRKFAARERERMRDRAAELAETLHLADGVDVLTSTEGLTGRSAKAKGWYDRRTGRITVVVPNHTSVADIERTLLHEGVAHYGLRRMFGRFFDTFLDNVYANAEEGIRARIDEAAARNGWDRRTATEEYLAELAESTDFERPDLQDWWHKIKNFFIHMLAEAGVRLNHALSDNDLRYVLWRSYQNLANPGRYRSVLQHAEDIAMRRRLKVGAYALEEKARAHVAERTDDIEDVNDRFNEQLGKVTEENIQQQVFNLGNPSAALLNGGVENMPIKLYGSKIAKKMKKHGFTVAALRDLPRAVANPIAVFNNYQKDGNRSVLTELHTEQGNILVTIDLGKGLDADFDIVSSVFGKSGNSVVNWLNKGFATYIDKGKALDYLHLAAPIAAASNNQELVSAANVVRNFENPSAAAEENADGGKLFRSGGGRFRDRETPQSGGGRVHMRQWYDAEIARGGWQAREAMQDSMLSLRTYMEGVMEASGKKMDVWEIDGRENPYLLENAMGSKTHAEQELYQKQLMAPLWDAVAQLTKAGVDYSDLLRYMMAKHGLERNALMRQREAQREYDDYMRKPHPADTTKTVADFTPQGKADAYNKRHPNQPKTQDDYLRDYAGLTAITLPDGVEKKDWTVTQAEEAARQIVADFESRHDTAELWQRVDAATKATLYTMYAGGFLDKAKYEEIRGMYQHYIPLRGWAETTSDEVYGYLDGDGSLSGNIMKAAKGRTIEADDPLATIGHMGDHAIQQANRNLMKQAFLNFALNHPSDLVSVSRLWLRWDDAAQEWQPVVPPDFRNAQPGQPQNMEEWDARMSSLAQAQPDKYKYGSEARNVPYRVKPGLIGDHVVLARRNGETFTLTVNGNPRLAYALNGRTNPNANSVKGSATAAAEWVNRVLSAGYTTLNPDFVLSNAIRDAGMANTLVWVRERPAYAVAFNVNYAKIAATKSLLGRLKRWEKGTLDMGDETDRLFKEFMDNGGETGYVMERDLAAHKELIEKELKARTSLRGAALAKMRDALSQWDYVNRAVENTARFAAYVTSRKAGRSVARSVWDAKEISVNFNKKGSGLTMSGTEGQTRLGNLAANASHWGRTMQVFWNAGVQGLNLVCRAAHRNPKKMLAMCGTLFTAGFAIALAAALSGGGGDDDDHNGYFDLSETVRRNNVCFKVGGVWVTIPLAIEERAVYGLGELCASVVAGRQEGEPEEIAMRTVEQVTQILPLDFMEGGGGLVNLLPSVAQPVAEAYMNQSWTGMPIYKDTEWNKNAPEWTKAYGRTNKALVAYCKFMNEIAGGDDVRKGFEGAKGILPFGGKALHLNNPAVLEHLANGYLGGRFSFPLKLWNLGETLAGARSFDTANVPLLNRLTRTADERTEQRNLRERWYMYNDEYERTAELLSGYRKRAERDMPFGVMEYAEKRDFLEHSPRYARYVLMDGYQKEQAKMRKERKEKEGDLYGRLSSLRDYDRADEELERKQAEEPDESRRAAYFSQREALAEARQIREAEYALMDEAVRVLDVAAELPDADTRRLTEEWRDRQHRLEQWPKGEKGKKRTQEERDSLRQALVDAVKARTE